jgi:ectoine hydroxylase-related dioxygenase (phytanoyl-CoA dioxygenase family)
VSSSFLPTFEPTSRENFNRNWKEENLKRLLNLYRMTGTLHLQNLFPLHLIETAREAYVERYQAYFQDVPPADSLVVGHRRVMISVHTKTPFDNSELYAHPLLHVLLSHILGPKFILLSYGSVTAAPGAKIQKLHVDHPPLFGLHDSLNASMPSFAVTLVVPLVDLTEETGTTRVWPGSHLFSSEEGTNADSVDVFTKQGSCYLMDYRTWHCGTPNVGASVRPSLYIIYARDWFRDAVNYDRQLPLLMEPEVFARVPAHLKHLFQWAFPR